MLISEQWFVCTQLSAAMWLFVFLAITCSSLSIINTVDGVVFIVSNLNHTNGTSTDDPNNFRIGQPCKMVIHGWFGSAKVEAVDNVKNSFMDCSDVNVIAVDWRREAQNLNYIQSAYETQKVGEEVCAKIVKLVEAGVCSLNSTHCIGHSLGAHVCAKAAKCVEEKLGEKIDRLTALDAAGPGFRNYPWVPTELEAYVATCTDGLYTDEMLGDMKPKVQKNYYMNGGDSTQPCCIYGDHVCGHRRSHQYYADAICDPWAFLAILCDSYENGKCIGNSTTFIGEEHCHNSTSGNYYVETGCPSNSSSFY